MSVAIRQPSTAVAMPENELIDVLRASLYPGAKTESVKMVLGYCKARGLDPMKKPVHIVPMYNREAGGMIDVIMPGVNSYRTDAARTGDYVGKSEPEFGPDITRNLGGAEVTFPAWCRMTVKRLVHGIVCEYTAKELWIENYATAKRDTQAPNSMWLRRAYGQLAKCTEAQALRMAFPEETGGTNTAEEMEGKQFAGVTIDHEPQRPVSAPRSEPDAIPALETPEGLRKRAERLINVIAGLKDGEKDKYLLNEKLSQNLIADIAALDDPARDGLHDMVMKALTFHRERCVPHEAPAYAEAEG